MDVDCLIFSKDRAAQLDLLLRSIREHAPRFYRSAVVLWDAGAPEYERAYRTLIAESKGQRLTFWREYDFERQVRHWLETASAPVSFLVDDDVFYRAPGPVGELPWSIRGGDYHYPFSLDGVIYRPADVRRLLDGLRFSDPTELEANGHEHRDRLDFLYVNAGEPCLTGLPWNRVSARSRMLHEGRHEFDLNEQYLAGGRFELPTFDGPQLPHTLDVNLPVVYA